MPIVKIGDRVCCQFGCGKLLALTKDWAIIDIKGEEYGIHEPTDEVGIYLPIDIEKSEKGSIKKEKEL